MGLWDQPNFSDIGSFILGIKKLQMEEEDRAGMDKIRDLQHKMMMDEYYRRRNERERGGRRGEGGMTSPLHDPQMAGLERMAKMSQLKQMAGAPISSSPMPFMTGRRPEDTWKMLDWVSGRTNIPPEKLYEGVLRAGDKMQGMGVADQPAGGDPFGLERTSPYGYGSGQEEQAKKLGLWLKYGGYMP